MIGSTGLLEEAGRLQTAGRTPEAARLYSQVLRTEPTNVRALHQLGLILFQHGQFADAERLLGEAVRLNPGSAESFYSRGCNLQQLGRHEEALAAFTRALSIAPDLAPARNNRGVTLLALARPAEALQCFDRVIASHPQLAMVHNNRATALLALKRPEEALGAAGIALGSNPNFPDALFSRGSALAALNHRTEALACFDRALAVDPQHADALVYRGIMLECLDRPLDAVRAYDAALRLRPDDSGILFNRTSALSALGRFEDALCDFDAILAANPHFRYAEGSRLFAKLQCCKWEDFDHERSAAIANQRAGYPVFLPLQAAALLTSDEDLKESARIWVNEEFPPALETLRQGERREHDRIRIAYVSGDFSYHPVMVLAGGIFERHERSRFEVTAVSTGPDDSSDFRRELERKFDRFIDMRDRSPLEIAEQIRRLEIDIAVDLSGFTKAAATAVFAHRACAIQVNFLGFPGTSAAPYFDYIIGDKTVIGIDRAQFFSENIAWLPHCCLPNDNRRRIGKPPTRAAAGLPEQGFVFCNFGKAHKITPDVFAAWTRLLLQQPDSVLWLAISNAAARQSLRREAESRHVSGDRLIFAGFVESPEEHLARITLADLFLDTFPYNAHATACDFLWAGVPVLTLTGGGFAGRVGASVLLAAGLPQLITNSLEEYERTALQLAQDCAAYHTMKETLSHNRNACPLFDTEQFTRDLESAFERMWQRFIDGESPTSFAVNGNRDPG